MKKILISTLITMSALSANTTPTEELFNNNCKICHGTDKMTPRSERKAPMIMGVAKRVKWQYTNRDDAVKFMVDFAKNPDASKSVFPAKAIEKNGLMPSMKGAMTDEEFKRVGEYIYDNFPFKMR